LWNTRRPRRRACRSAGRAKGTPTCAAAWSPGRDAPLWRQTKAVTCSARKPLHSRGTFGPAEPFLARFDASGYTLVRIGRPAGEDGSYDFATRSSVRRREPAGICGVLRERLCGKKAVCNAGLTVRALCSVCRRSRLPHAQRSRRWAPPVSAPSPSVSLRSPSPRQPSQKSSM